MAISRRDFIVTSALASASALYAEPAPKKYIPPTLTGFLTAPTARPLPFDSKNLIGISERLILSHHTNNYTGAVKRLGLINAQIAALNPDAPPFARGSLAKEALTATNSMILHELYFDNLGYSGDMGLELRAALEKSFGSVDKWQKDFTNIAMSLSGGSGWVVLAYCDRLGMLTNIRAESHNEGLAYGTPILVCDMYEHSYQMDFGANAKAYLEAFFKNINYAVVENRLTKIIR